MNKKIKKREQVPQSGEQKSDQKLPYDIRLIFSVLFLVGIGIIMVYSASSALALERFGNGYYFLKKQAIFAVLGVILMICFSHIPYQIFQRLTYIFLILTISLLIAVKIPGIGHSAGGATRWLRFAGFSFQPSEFARFSMIIYLAYSLNKKKEKIADFYIGFVPHVSVLLILTLFILGQPDFGSVVILSAITWIMMFTGGVKIKHLTLSLLPILPLFYLFMIKAEYRLKRLITFINPWQDPLNQGYQIIHSLMAFGTGGTFGTGIGQGYQKLFYLPEPHTDFIFSVIGEELGLLGIIVIIGCYITILFRGIKIAYSAQDRFSTLLSTGITISISLQVIINIGVTLGLLPTKGLTLPFLSYGGTSLIFNMISIGILMNIGRAQNG